MSARRQQRGLRAKHLGSIAWLTLSACSFHSLDYLQQGSAQPADGSNSADAGDGNTGPLSGSEAGHGNPSAGSSQTPPGVGDAGDSSQGGLGMVLGGGSATSTGGSSDATSGSDGVGGGSNGGVGTGGTGGIESGVSGAGTAIGGSGNTAGTGSGGSTASAGAPACSSSCTPLTNNATYVVHPRHDIAMCADDRGRNPQNGASVIQYACNGQRGQEWTAIDRGSGYYAFKNVLSGRCLEVAKSSTTANAATDLYTCSYADNQLWLLRATSGGFYELVAKHSGLALDVDGAASTTSDLSLVQNAYDGSLDMQWRFDPASG